MKKKGFTLIELLAVIVVLAIIAIIATPMVLNTIDDAKKGAAKADAYVYAAEVEKYMVLAQLDPTKPQLQPGVTYQLSSKKYEVASLADPNEVFINDLVQMNGNKPTSGYLVMNNDGKINKMEMIIDSYPIEFQNGECEIKGEAKEEDPKEDDIVVSNKILDKAKALVYDASGVCKTDGSTYNYMGGCYIKGTSTNNYVWYNGFMWRIMGINSDNTVRLIIDENVTSLIFGHKSTYVTAEGCIHDWLNEYFYDRINSTKSIIQNGTYFCSESTNGETLTEGRTTCTSGNEVTAKVGIISVDEYILAGKETSYLNIGQDFWTTTSKDDSNVFYISSGGGVASLSNASANASSGVRPIINVNSDVVVTSGTGTSTAFYVLSEDKTTSVTGMLSEKVTSGEYVLLEDKIYRVVSKDDSGIKLILDGFYEESLGTPFEMSYGDSNKFILDSGIGQKLNSDVLTWLGLSTSDKIVATTYYQGAPYVNLTYYANLLEKTNGIEAKVGLIQLGDILSGQSSTMLTKNYTVESSQNNVKTYWTMKQFYNNIVGHILNSGRMDRNYPTREYGVRPVITVRNNLNITGGTGVWNNPYQI